MRLNLAPDLTALWAIDERYLRDMVSMADAARAAGAIPQAAMPGMTAGADDKPYAMDGTTAVISLIGPLTKYTSFWSWFFGGTSTEEAREALTAALADEAVTDVRLHIDSPGGTVAGTVDLANAIYQARSVKPIEGYISDCALSGAWWIASQCSRIVANNAAALLGNQGTVLRVVDSSKAAGLAGLEVKLYRSSPIKGAGTAGTPITEAQDAEFQSIVDGIQKEFVAAVMRGRGASAETVAEWSSAHTYTAREALAAGLIDAIGPMEPPVEEECAEGEGDGEEGDGDGDCDDLDAKQQKKAKGAAKSPNVVTTVTIHPGAITVHPDATKNTSAAIAEKVVAALTNSVSVPHTTKPAPNPQTAAAARTATVLRGQEGFKMKEKLVRVLTALGLRRMAVAVVGVTSEEPEALASAMAEQVNEEVQAKLDAHPLLMACTAAGITAVTDLQAILELKALGDEYITGLKTEAKLEAVRAYGQETAAAMAASVDKLPASQLKALRDSCRTFADAKFGIGENGQAAARVSASAARVATAADEAAEPKTAWEQLTPEQQKYASQFGDTPEKREKIAAEFLARKNGEGN
jgi:signal peptide peptidase SppA